MASGCRFTMQRFDPHLAAVFAISMGCGPEPRDEGHPRPPVGGDSAPAAPVTIDDESELGAACPSTLDSCPPNPTSPCRVSCQPAADGCTEVWELQHVATAPPSNGAFWQAINPQGEHGLFSWAVNDGDDDYNQPERFTWGAAEGVVSLSAAVGNQPFFDLYGVSDDASVAIGVVGLDPLFWSRAGGIEPLPVQNPALARDGSLVAGQAGRRAVRWVRGQGATTVFELESDRYSAQAEGGAALFVERRRLVYSPAESEPVIIEAPADASPRAVFGQVVLSANGSSFAAELQDGNDTRLYRWVDGALARIDLPPPGPEPTIVVDLKVSADGGVIVARVGPSSYISQRLIRWSTETGSQVLSEDPTLYVSYLSPTGNVILGGVEMPDDNDIGLRWSVEDGMQETPPYYAADRAALDGAVLVDMDAEGPVVRKYGPDAANTLPLEHLRGRLPSRWDDPQLGRLSPDARVLAGTAHLAPEDRGRDYTLEELLELEARGVDLYPEPPELLWVARLRDVCPAGQ
jgi:hypothetical protein